MTDATQYAGQTVRIHLETKDGEPKLWLGVELTGNEETDRKNLADLAWAFYQGMLSQ